MAEETLAQIDEAKTANAEEGIADFLFGKDEPEYEPEENVQVEGDDEEVEEVEEKEEVEATEETVEIEVDGEILEVPAKYKDYFLRQADYTKKTQEVAQQRQEVEVIHNQLLQQRQAFEFAESIRDDVFKAEQLDATANQYHQYLRDNIDTLSHTEIEKLRMAIEDARRERDEIGRNIHGKQQEFQQSQQQSIQELLNKGTEILRSKIPGWGEDQQRQVRDYALNLGFSEAEVNQVIDPRQVEVLYKAAQYDSLQRNKSAAVKKVQAAPTIKRARDPDTGQFVKQKAKLNKALKSDKLSAPEKASLIGEDIASRFFS